MYNMLLDPLPTDYMGYLIRTDYRIGIQISQALEDEELDQMERLQTAALLLFGYGIPDDYETILGGLRWFMNGSTESVSAEENNEEDTGPESGLRYFSFDVDASRLYSAFRRTYGIEIDRVQMHWFQFCALMGDLGDCAFTNVIDFRTADVSKMDKDTKRAYLKMRRKFALPQPESEESEEFMALLKAGEGET